MFRLRTLCLVSCLGAALLLGAHAQSTCGPTINFQPPGSEDENLPAGWQKSAQVQAGNPRTDFLYNIALTSTKNLPSIDGEQASPVLQVLPVHDLLVEGSTPSSTCMGYGATATAQRHLMASGIVTAPAKYKVQYTINKTLSIVDLGEFQSTLTAPKIVLDELAGFEDGYYCMSIKVTIIAGTGLVGSLAVPLKDLQNTTEVCFFKLDAMPNATVEFETCSETFGVTISDMQPAPVPLFPGSSELLFRPVFHFQSTFNRTEDGSWPSDTPGKMDEYVIIGSAAEAAKPFVYTPDDQFTDGYWNVKLESALATSYPSLLSLGVAGVDRYNTDEDTPEELQGLFKILKYDQFPQGKLLGIQNKPTKFISMDGPDLGDKIPVNAEISFNWDFDGFGKQYCWIDGLKYYNDAEFTCKPPINMVLPNTKNHTLTVTLQDVCGKNMTVEVTYGTFGYALTKVPKAVADSATVADADLTGGGVYDTAATNTGRTATRRSSTSDAAGLRSSMGLLWLPMMMLMVMHAGRQATA